MPRKCFWTRKLELELIDFVRQRRAIWKPAGNTNHDIQLKYKAYAEFAEKLGIGFTARSVRDRWVNIRSTFNHNLRKVKRSEQENSAAYVPCWPLWKPLQFLRDDAIIEFEITPEGGLIHKSEIPQVKVESHIDFESNELNVRTDRPRMKNLKDKVKKKKSSKCVKVIDNLIEALNPLLKSATKPSFWFFGKHVTERLDCMREVDAQCASQMIMRLVNDWTQSDGFT